MRSVQTVGSTHAQRARISPACLALSGTGASRSSGRPDVTHPPSWVPFAPRPLQALHRYYGPCDSCRIGSSVPLWDMNTAPICPAGIPASRARPSRPFCPQPPNVPRGRFHTLPFSASGFPPFGRSGLRHWLAGSLVRRAETGFSSCGLVGHLLLLPTPPHGDAVAVGFRPESACLERDFTSPVMHARGRTSQGRQALEERCARNTEPRRGRQKPLSVAPSGLPVAAGPDFQGLRPWLHSCGPFGAFRNRVEGRVSRNLGSGIRCARRFINCKL